MRFWGIPKFGIFVIICFTFEPWSRELFCQESTQYCYKGDYLYWIWQDKSDILFISQLSMVQSVITGHNFLISGLVSQRIIPISCNACFWCSYSSKVDLVSVGLWPLDCQFEVFLDFNFILYMSTLQHFSPPLSLGSLLSTIKFVSTLHGTVRYFTLILQQLYKITCKCGPDIII